MTNQPIAGHATEGEEHQRENFQVDHGFLVYCKVYNARKTCKVMKIS